MGHNLLKHPDNPFKIGSKTFAVEESKVLINGPSRISFLLLERPEDGSGWTQLDKWTRPQLKEATGKDWDSLEECEDIAVQYLQEVAEDFYA